MTSYGAAPPPPSCADSETKVTSRSASLILWGWEDHPGAGQQTSPTFAPYSVFAFVVVAEQGRGGEVAKGHGCSLHRGLIAEDNFQFLAVQLSPIREIHDALSVACELLDCHLLEHRREDMLGSGNTFQPYLKPC